MMNIITDWLFTNAYTVINVCMVLEVILLITGIIEAGQEEVEELVEFYEEEEHYEDYLASLNERA